MKLRHLYVVTGDAGDLEGWSPEELAQALEGCLGHLNIYVVCRPRQFGGGGLVVHPDASPDEEHHLHSQVDAVVSRVICG